MRDVKIIYLNLLFRIDHWLYHSYTNEFPTTVPSFDLTKSNVHMNAPLPPNYEHLYDKTDRLSFPRLHALPQRHSDYQSRFVSRALSWPDQCVIGANVFTWNMPFKSSHNSERWLASLVEALTGVEMPSYRPPLIASANLLYFIGQSDRKRPKEMKMKTISN